MAAGSKVTRPSQYNQSSRKGKKAWRKNIDLTDIEHSIESKAEQEITHGVQDITSLRNDALFHVDETGDEVLKSKLIKRKQIKKNIKSREILEGIRTQSKVSPLEHIRHKEADEERKKKKEVQGVSKHEMKKLLALGGKLLGESKLKHRVSEDGLVRADNERADLWGDTQEDKVRESVPSAPTSGWSRATVKPATLDMEPERLVDTEADPHAGNSYNPDRAAWKDLFEKEYKLAKQEADRAEKLEAYRARIKFLSETLDDNEVDDSTFSEEEVEEHGEQREEEELTGDTDKYKLSLNAPVENKKKTKYQRNKMKRHEERLKMQEELKKLKEQVKALENLDEIQKSLETSDIMETTKRPTTSKKVGKKAKETKERLLGDRLKVKLEHELSDSFRKLKPEGHLVRQYFNDLKLEGKLDSRRRNKKGRRYKPKITEKWTYKDFK